MKEFSFSRLQLYEQCPQRFYYKYVLGLDEPITKPLALGKAVHKAIELIIKGIDKEEAIKEGMKECDFHNEVSIDEVRQLVENAPFQKLKGQTELYFRLPLFNEENSPVLQGYIDLVDGNKIVDFKTNRIAYNILDNYQIALYSWAISKINGFSVVDGSLLFLRHKSESTYSFNEAIMNEALNWARNLVKEINIKLEILDYHPTKWNELFPYKASNVCSHCPFSIECYKANPI